MNYRGASPSFKKVLSYTIVFLAGIVIGMNIGPLLSLSKVHVREVTFDGPGRKELVGKVYFPPALFQKKYDGILLCHGVLPKGKDTALYVELARQLARRGYLVMTFDFRGFGESAKVANFRVPRDLNFPAEAEAAVSFMLEKLPVREEGYTIAGHSMGANIAFAVGAQDKRVKNIITISAGNFRTYPAHLAPRHSSFTRRLERCIGASISPDESLRIKEGADLFQYLPLSEPKNVLVALAECDAGNIIDYNNRFFEELNGEKDLLMIHNSNHNFGFDMNDANELIDPLPVRHLASGIHRWLSAKHR